MTQEEKELLLKQDLCARLPYGVKVDAFGKTEELLGILHDIAGVGYDINDFDDYAIEDIKPYLRPMSSMTKKEKNRYDILVEETVYRPGVLTCSSLINFCHEHHIDNLGLIEKGLALEAPEGMYKTK